MAVDHYENFPVASILLPRRLVPAVEAIYAFARSADDLADEGDATPGERLAALQAYDAQLDRIEAGSVPDEPMFARLAHVVAQYRLSVEPMRALLSAFRQDVVTPRYQEYASLLDYCHRSADPEAQPRLIARPHVAREFEALGAATRRQLDDAHRADVFRRRRLLAAAGQQGQQQGRGAGAAQEALVFRGSGMRESEHGESFVVALAALGHL